MRHLLVATCALGLLAAGPVLAQNETKPADGATMGQPSGSQPSMNKPSGAQSNNAGSMNNGSGMNANSGSADQSGMQADSGSMNKSMHKPMHTAHNGKSDTSQNARVDELNDQSYQAAQQGRSFTVGDTGSGSSMNTPSSSGSSGMNSASPSDSSGMGAGGGAGGMTKSDGAK
jgi:hypothetical protein